MFSSSKLKYGKICINLINFQRYLSFRKKTISSIFYISVCDFLHLFLSYHKNRLRLLLSSPLDICTCFLSRKYSCPEAEKSRIQNKKIKDEKAGRLRKTKYMIRNILEMKFKYYSALCILSFFIKIQDSRTYLCEEYL